MTALTIGDHRFSETDARQTLRHAFDLLDLYPLQAIAHQEPRRRRVADGLAAHDPSDRTSLEATLRAVWSELLDARDELCAADALPPSATGSVVQLNVSGGGVPKLPVERVDVGFGGMAGDRQAARQHHGRPWQALCLWSSEVIAGLAAEGHPIAAGNAGENVTIAGLVWTDVQPGVRLRLGTVLCQVSAFALPCQKNAGWFSDRDFTRIHHEKGPLSRVYATVLRPGTIATGDAVVLEPGD